MVRPDEAVVGGSEACCQALVCRNQEVVSSNGDHFGVVRLSYAFKWKLSKMNTCQISKNTDLSTCIYTEEKNKGPRREFLLNYKNSIKKILKYIDV